MRAITLAEANTVIEASLARAKELDLKPLSVIAADPEVQLDRDGKMQCTTCHDPHTDLYHQPGKVPRFWVKPTVGELCQTCHAPR